MTKIMRWVLVGVAAALPAAVSAAEVTGSASVDVASAYVFRGATLNDGFVVQPGLEVGGLPFTLGVWGNLDIDDYDGARESGQFSEIDLYASYGKTVKGVELLLSYYEYTYPSGGGDADREVAAGAGLDVLLSPSVTVVYGLDGAVEQSLYVEAGLSHSFEFAKDLSLELGAALGYLSPDEGESGFSHAQGTLGLAYKIISASVTYVAQLDDDVLPDVEDGGDYDVSVIGMVGVSLDF